MFILKGDSNMMSVYRVMVLEILNLKANKNE